MTDLRPADSFSDCCSQEKAFWEEALQWQFWTRVEQCQRQEMSWLCVTAGRSSSKHLTKKDIGIGSSEQVFGADLSITFRTCSSETGWNASKTASVYGSSWIGDTDVWRSRSSRISFTLFRKYSENTSGHWSEGRTVGRGQNTSGHWSEGWTVGRGEALAYTA